MQSERLLSLARRLLAIPTDNNTADTWLCEHSERVQRLALQIAALPALRHLNVDGSALAAAALFHDAGWVVEYHQGKWKRWQLLTRPTSDIQRELGAALLKEEGAPLLSAQSTRLACEAIRQCNSRQARSAEAQVLAEAEALDEVSTLHVLRQFRLYQGEGRPIQQLVDTWKRQREYRFWDSRLADGFRFELTRELARRRLADVDAFLGGLARDLGGTDLRGALDASGAVASPADAGDASDAPAGAGSERHDQRRP